MCIRDRFEYPFIARAEGTYDLEPVEFTFFDPQRMQYVTLKSKPLTLEITPDARGGGSGDAAAGHHAVMTPSNYCYLDFCQDDPTTEPVAAAAFLTLEQAYSYDPAPDSLGAGVVPMILGGSTFWAPVGVTIFAGGIGSLVLVVTILPVLYSKIYK